MRKLTKLLSVLVPLFASSLLVSPGAAVAASGSDLAPTITVSGSSLVGTTTHYDVHIQNSGNRNSGAINVYRVCF